MALTSSLLYPISLLLCLAIAARVLAAPPEPEVTPTTRDVPVTPAPYTEATPSSDCTLSNVSSSIEEILVEVGVLQDTETR